MTFWAIVLGIIAVTLLLAWRHDRRRTGQVGDLNGRAGVPRRYVSGAELYQDLPPPQEENPR